MLFDKPVEVNSFRSFEEEDFNITVDLAWIWKTIGGQEIKR